ncbi:hypothetical protein [Sphaerisporangium perillae]|uniref:hypothetical protein n=1 Tax=Sphaerisporangium perillae TaxID=2935860 RepID=UPI00200D46B6|nr:hypothetical protein [Sphaerisporangium perillae]
MTDFLIHAGLIVVAAVVALKVWRRLHTVSFWLVLGFPLKALAVYGTWRAVSSGCGLARRRRRWRWTLPGFPGMGR